jgi:glycosyltransferase involved in cell wall biosynthesis
MLRIALVANLPPPYRVPVYQRIAALPDVRLHVFFCCRREPNRHWDLPPMDFEHTYLKERFFTVDGRYIHNNPDVLKHLKKFAPDVVVINGFNPTHLYSVLYALLTGRALVPMTDGTQASERSLSLLHKTVRTLVYGRSDAFIAASNGGRALYRSYGIAPERCFLSCLCTNNEAFKPGQQATPKKYDFIFSGRIEPVKNPLFALKVAISVALRLKRKVHILFIGAGSLEEMLHEAAASEPDLIVARFAGFATQADLPQLYLSARILLMPTRWDPWGMVINEACAAGLPVIVTPAAGAAQELVRDLENGYVSELKLDLWTQQATALLTDDALYARFSNRSRELVRQFTFDDAVNGFVSACRAALARYRIRHRLPPRSKPRVLIVERQLLHYRVAVYQRLRAQLARHGIDLQLLIGEGTAAEIKKKDQTSLDWSIAIPTRYLLHEKVCWQPFGRYAKQADLVIVMHENKLVYNLWLLSLGRPRRLAFWGHGRNMQSARPSGLKERFKRWTVNKVDWWFAYTDGSAALVNEAGFPSARTTIVENAVDTREMIGFCKGVTPAQCDLLRQQHHLGTGPVGLYLGSLYQEKRLDFLLEAARRIKLQVPDFQLLIVGAGPEGPAIERAARQYAWVHYLGPLQGRDKAKVLVLADVMLNPGLVGLGVLDSFVSGTPMFTTDCGLHSPEISYLASGSNGVITDDDVGVYADVVSATLRDPKRLAALQRGALDTASRYTLENMTDRLFNGIVTCLSTP